MINKNQSGARVFPQRIINDNPGLGSADLVLLAAHRARQMKAEGLVRSAGSIAVDALRDFEENSKHIKQARADLIDQLHENLPKLDITEEEEDEIIEES